MWEPDSYVGETIRMRGQYAVYQGENPQEYYHAVIISDATACCAQGLEFLWQGKHVYPDDYPEPGSEFEVAGVFRSLDDNGITYYAIETDLITLP